MKPTNSPWFIEVASALLSSFTASSLLVVNWCTRNIREVEWKSSAYFSLGSHGISPWLASYNGFNFVHTWERERSVYYLKKKNRKQVRERYHRRKWWMLMKSPTHTLLMKEKGIDWSFIYLQIGLDKVENISFVLLRKWLRISTSSDSIGIAITTIGESFHWQESSFSNIGISIDFIRAINQGFTDSLLNYCCFLLFALSFLMFLRDNEICFFFEYIGHVSMMYTIVLNVWSWMQASKKRTTLSDTPILPANF